MRIAKKKVLVIEDDRDVLDLLSTTLGKTNDLTVSTASDGGVGLSMARKEHPNVILLDLMLPTMSGLEICRALKSDTSTRHIPILMLTAKADEVDRIVGLELGADDYVTKPFSPREVALRLQALIRRRDGGAEQPTGQLTAGGITLDANRHLVMVSGRKLRLTTTEFKLLAALLENRGRVLGRDRLLNQVWGYEAAFDTRTVDTHVRRLREKLGNSGTRIETVRGFGYRFAEGD